MIIKITKPIKIKKSAQFELNLTNNMKEKIDACWTTFIKNKKDYWDGEIVIVTNIDIKSNTLEVSKTKYSSLLYAKNNEDLTIRSLFASILLKTKDSKYVIIRNNHDKINLIGGLADLADFNNDYFIPDLCIEREVLEEIGIDLKDKSQVLDYQMKYLKIPMNNENYYPVGVLYTGELNFTSQEFEKYLNSHIFDGEIKECYFYTLDECLKLDLTQEENFYLKEFVMLENERI